MGEVGRRSTQVRGFVDFPINDPRYRNSGEGGMFVRLVVVPHFSESVPGEDWEVFYRRMKHEEWMVCSGGMCHILWDEELLGDDRTPDPPRGVLVENFPAEEKHFPGFKERSSREPGDLMPYLSREYLCALTLGSTGWSGWDEEKGEHFRCRLENLTPAGKELYELLTKLYAKRGTLYLQTWLDT